MYYAMRASAPSLHRESTDSLICSTCMRFVEIACSRFLKCMFYYYNRMLKLFCARAPFTSLYRELYFCSGDIG